MGDNFYKNQLEINLQYFCKEFICYIKKGDGVLICELFLYIIFEYYGDEIMSYYMQKQLVLYYC